ncbi:putative signal recognition particle protein [Parathielavia appendiculata]|uniref:Signal recognition particle receptor subunit beta n=1 Tax=Parathielavia appendiculata TaxID=2587402 RepID=A0AAN6TYJ1_9PEZI|nr:putative signal recognition particle protein [Parathielavia appendiculata]
MSTIDTLKAAFEASLTPTPSVISIGLAIVLLIPIILHFIFSATTPYTTLPSVLLVGPSGAGKTALLTLFERGPLYHNNNPAVPTPVAETHTSQTPSTVELAVSTDRPTTTYRTDLDATGATAKKFLLIDTPGHPKLRRHALAHLASPSATITPSLLVSPAAQKGEGAETSKSKLKALVFLVDAAALADTDSAALSSTAEYLYDVLLTLQRRFLRRSGSRAPSNVPVLVAANKLDLFTALPAALVKSQLEAELSRIRKTRSKGLLDSGEADGEVVGGEEGEGWLGAVGSDKFSFKEMVEFDIEVEVIGGNVVGDGPGADKWWKWIGERI